ncbi:hypothetical protein FACS189450_00480 [Spirochaetia bacterium]|nr:hypothetical protein FACS189450_00480 [Spirochaetia bacterium]
MTDYTCSYIIYFMELMDIIVPKGTSEQIEAIAAAYTGTEDQIITQLIHLGLKAYRAGELNDGGTI